MVSQITSVLELQFKVKLVVLASKRLNMDVRRSIIAC